MSSDRPGRPHHRAEEVAGEWSQDNQQWWNQYIASADNGIAVTGDYSTELEPAFNGPLPTSTELAAELNGSFEIDPLAVSAFNRDGYVKLKAVLSPGALTLLRREMEASLQADLGDDPGLDFRSGEMMWLSNEIFRQFVLSPRIAGIAAALLGVERVRLYHDNALAKEPGCGRTPWHYDEDHFPIATKNICTAWIPLQAIPRGMGPLAFAVGMQSYELVKALPLSRFDKRYDRAINDTFAEHDVPVDDGAFALGEISFHHAQSCHAAGPNRTTQSRMALATTYFEDGARVVAAPTMVSGDWRKFMPGVGPGELINSPYNPICFPAGG